MKLDGAHVVVTGASQGTGAALTRELTRRGATVTAIARNAAALERLADETGAVAYPADLSRLDVVGGLVAQITDAVGPIDGLVNNAAIGGVGAFADSPAGTPEAIVNTNLLAPTLLTRDVLPGMLTRGRGTVVMVSSVAGELALPNAAVYGATKAGLTMLADGLRCELRARPVTVMSVVLGEVDTPMLDAVRADPVMSKVRDRLGMIPALSAAAVASRLADAIARDRRTLVLPAVLRPMVVLRRLPARCMDLAMTGAHQ